MPRSRPPADPDPDPGPDLDPDPDLEPAHPHGAHPDPHGSAHHEPEPRRWTALAVICLAQFVLILDVTVVNVALPDLAVDLDLTRSALTWAVTAYTLCFGGLMLLGGRLADAFGARRMMTVGILVFTTASLLTGLAQNAPQLLGGRMAQGVGAALLSPAALSLVTTMFHGAERTRALGVWAAVGGSGSAAGVLIGGALTDGPGWRWAFYLNVPVGIAVLAVLPALVAARPARPARLDVPGALLVTAGTGALIYGLVRAGDQGWADAVTLLCLFGSLALYGLFWLVERTSRAPLMDLRMFTRRPVLAGAFLMLVATALLLSFFFLGSVYLQHVRGHGAFRTGLLFLPVAVGTAAGAHLGSRWVGRIGARPTAVGGLAVAAVGCLPLTALDAGTPVYTVVLPGLAFASLGIGAVFVTATATALALVEPQESGLASGVVNTFHEVGGSVGVAVVSTVAAAGIDRGTPGGFADAFTLGAVVAAVGAVVSLALVPRGKPQLSGVHVH
ncbi:MFS transporter [Streptomyces sp. NPDC059816]|uniref:MFS transporter n=1 Tax=Streptomyces sp. NPDC059816 TaxID=3346960 RepID=UPI003651D590